jgi:hypothetical protein
MDTSQAPGGAAGLPGSQMLTLRPGVATFCLVSGFWSIYALLSSQLPHSERLHVRTLPQSASLDLLLASWLSGIIETYGRLYRDSGCSCNYVGAVNQQYSIFFC